MEIMLDETDGHPLWPTGALILAVGLIILWRKQRSLSYLFCCAVFGVYLLFVLDRVFFPIRVLENETMDSFQWSINLIPLKFNFDELPNIVLMQIVLNTLLTVPVGFGLSFITPVRAKTFLWLAPAVGLWIELIQLIISLVLRYPYRIIDINDVLLNTLGVWIGYAGFRVFAWMYVKATQRLKLGGLAKYIHTVASRSPMAS